jgi:RNA-directed DNA polymerase
MSIHSQDGNTWSTKLERIHALAIAKPDTVFNNVGHVVSVDMLRDLYHELDGSKAIGIDKVTKVEYGENLEGNLNGLIRLIRRGTYKPQPSRIVEIPKEDGSMRPLAICCFEDKLVQLAVNKILSNIYEPIFLPSSYGFRPNQNCHVALRALNAASYRFPNGALVEIDIRKYFNTIPHGLLFECLRKKISDRRFLHLLQALITAPICEGNTVEKNTIGVPQGSIVSSTLSNAYLHYVIDVWFEEIKKTHIKGDAKLVRYADDMVFVFERKTDAKRFYETLPKRLGKYGLTLHADKSQLIASGRKAAQMAVNNGDRLKTYKFLGFTCYWGMSNKRKFWRLKFTSRADRFTRKLKGLREFLRKSLNANTEETIKRAIKVVVGWINYHGITDNEKRVKSFIKWSRRILFWWANRRGGRKRLNWEMFQKKLDRLNFPKTYKTVSMFQNAWNKA